MNISEHDFLSLSFIKSVYLNDKKMFIRFKIKDTNYGFDYYIKEDRCSPILHFRNGSTNFNGRKGYLSFDKFLCSIPDEYIAMFILNKHYFKYE